MSNQEQNTTFKVEARAYPIKEPKGSTIAFASVTVEDMFAVRGIKVINGEKGIFTAMPSMPDGKGGYQDVAFPVAKGLRGQMHDAVMEAYNAALEKAPPEKASVKEQIKEGVKEKAAPAAAKNKTTKKSGPEL